MRWLGRGSKRRRSVSREERVEKSAREERSASREERVENECE